LLFGKSEKLNSTQIIALNSAFKESISDTPEFDLGL
jgi:hypothetical protein